MTDRRSFLGLASTAAAGAAAIASLIPSSPARAEGKPKGNARLYIKDWGEGRPVILSHGWPLTADSWDHHACALVDAGYRVISFDRRGFGRSAQPSSGYDYDTFADDLAEVIKTTGARDAALFGFSMGGAEVLRYMARHGSAKKVSKIGLIGAAVPYLLKTPDNPAGIDGSIFEGMKEGVRKDRPTVIKSVLKDVLYDLSIQGTNPVTQEVLDWSFQMAMQAGLKSTLACIDVFSKTDLRPDLAAVNVPALVVHGTADKAVPFELARQAAARITKAKLVEYKGSTHGILVTERDRVTKDMLAFLAA